MEGCNNPPAWKTDYCDGCIKAYRAIRFKMSSDVYFLKCEVCGELFTTRYENQMYCSDCRGDSQLVNPRHRECKICGTIYKLERGVNFDRYCSYGCRDEGTTINRRSGRSRRRALERNAFIEDISIVKLFFRDNGRCHICNMKLNLKRAVPEKRAATIDHVIPLAEGGMHEYKNVKLACFLCNCIKSDGRIAGGEQLLLFGI